MEDMYNREEVGVQCNYIKLLCTIYLGTDIINVCTVIDPLDQPFLWFSFTSPARERHFG